LTLNKQAKFWTTYNHIVVPWAFFVVNNGGIPNYDSSTIRWNICFPYVFPLALIENKTKEKNKSLHTRSLLGQVL
jgi:hypothetical protein